RDGLKPVHRRILYQMRQMGLRPDRPHVKCARVVGDVMGKLHPHGDAAIYDALVRMAQPFAMRLPLVDGHGNFGSLGGDDPPAAYRYTECRLTDAALALTDELDEGTVDFVPNYDGQETEPLVLPAAFPNLLVNGASGIAVGMATNIPPHNLAETIAAVRLLLRRPEVDLDALMEVLPGPDFPTGGVVVDGDGIRESYATGRGSFRLRARVHVTKGQRGRHLITVTELPYGVGPERVISRVKDLIANKKLVGISDIRDLTDRSHGLRVVIETKPNVDPNALLEELYRLTPMEESFGVNTVALVDGKPRTLSVKEVLETYIEHRLLVTRRRCEFRAARHREQLHLVEGRLTAIADIDEVIAIIRGSDDAAAASRALMSRFSLSEIQARDILEMPLRRLTKFSRIELEQQRDELARHIAELEEILGSPEKLRVLVGDELAEVARRFATPRRTELPHGGTSTAAPTSDAAPAASADLRASDHGHRGDLPSASPCAVVLSASGLLVRAPGPRPLDRGEARTRHDAIAHLVVATREVGLVTNRGRVLRVDLADVPVCAPVRDATDSWLADGRACSQLANLGAGESVVGLMSLDDDQPEYVVATAAGRVARVAARRSGDIDFPVDADDPLVAVFPVLTGGEDLVLVTTDATLLRSPISELRPRPGRTTQGIRMVDGARLLFAGAVAREAPAVVVSIAGSSTTLPGTEPGSVKTTRLAEFPSQHLGGKGVRCHRFLRGEDCLLFAWAGPAPARALTADGYPVPLPPVLAKRDAGGTRIATPIAAIGW
ncbi:MAG: DNA topoisomerase 4 subunit A, partial [Acidothermus sp.]|nr:DNA topoisomerase 4 subunit A [Acidothermus sp.]